MLFSRVTPVGVLSAFSIFRRRVGGLLHGTLATSRVRPLFSNQGSSSTPWSSAACILCDPPCKNRGGSAPAELDCSLCGLPCKNRGVSAPAAERLPARCRPPAGAPLITLPPSIYTRSTVASIVRATGLGTNFLRGFNALPKLSLLFLVVVCL